MKRRIIIVGGGAAGFFSAIAAAEKAKRLDRAVDIQILEASGDCLRKLRISGGGRCNVTHNIFEARRFCENYPQGSRELISPMQRFQAKDTVEWFAKRGVRLVAEDDGRMFPDTNTSETIIECFMQAARELDIRIRMKSDVKSIFKGDPLRVNLSGGEVLPADSVMVATGSSPAGYRKAREMGHAITELAPSLFSFRISDPLLMDMSGLSFPNAAVRLEIEGAKAFREKGPLLVTHWGLSGPAALKISAWAAREMKRADYQGSLHVNWLGLQRAEEATELLMGLKSRSARSQIANVYPEGLPGRFWSKLLQQTAVPLDKLWADASRKQIRSLAEALFATKLKVDGKNRYKDEFVECGGVSLNEIDFRTMESRICPGLFFVGEILDVDGITGGFNF